MGKGAISQSKIVLVTGAGGFIGSHVSKVLLDRGDMVIGVDEINDYYDVRIKNSNIDDLVEYDNFSFRKGDICDISFISAVFEEFKPTHICHLAARAGVRPSINDPYIYVHSNVEGTTRLLDLARTHNVINFVYASSSSVYGSSTAEILTEEDVVEKPVSPYAATKKACELLAYTFHHLYGLNTTGLRFFTVYGPRGRPDMAPFKFIDRIFNGLEIQQYGDGSTSRDYTYISDIVDGVVRSIDRPLGYQVFNLGNGRPFLLKDFISLVEDKIGKKAKIRIMPEQPGDVKRTCACIKKAKELLGYEPKVAFEDGIAMTANWYREAHAKGVFDVDSDEDSPVPSPSSTPSNTNYSNLHSNLNNNVFNDMNANNTNSGGFNLLKTNRNKEFNLPKDRLSRAVSDLELSSFVQKASIQVDKRTGRYHDTNHSSDFNDAYKSFYSKQMQAKAQSRAIEKAVKSSSNGSTGGDPMISVVGSNGNWQ